MTGNVDIDEIICKLLHGLKAGGYSIGTDAYIKTRQLFHWFLNEKKGNSLASFAPYLAPVICKSDEEQHNFKKIFEDIFLGNFAEFEKKLRQEEQERVDREKAADEKKRKSVTKIVAVISLIIVCAVAALWYFTRSKIIVDYGKLDKKPLFVNRNSETPLSHAAIFNDAADSSKFDVEYNFHHSHQIKKGTSVTHRFEHYGKDTIDVKLKSQPFSIDTTITYPEVYVGPENELTIIPEKSVVASGETNSYTASIDTAIHAGFYWEIIKLSDSNKREYDSINNPFKHKFNDTGEYLITVKYNTQKDSFLQKFPDEYTSASYLQKVIPPGLHLVTTYNPPPELITAAVNKIWTVILVALSLLLLYAAFSIIRKKTQPVKFKEDNFNGDKPPYDLQFISKEQNISAGYSLLRLSNDLKKRVESRSFFFDASKTIRQSILNRGFITPGFIQKQTHREYLFLIDQAYTNSQQMKLFSYLARYFIDHQVKLDFYFYHQTPDRFYKEVDGPRMTLENIKDRYYSSALILFADGANFIDYETMRLKEKVAGGFAYWPSRVLITPVPFFDWAKNEKILSSFFNVLPADLIGLLELIRAIDTDTSEKLFLGQFGTYEAKYTDFNNIDALKEYLGNGELFQWVCALAVHPKIYWEITLEIGKSIVKDQNDINYDTLLKLARVRWIAEGSFPPSTRLELLKKLTKENEIKARESLLAMLEEIPADEMIFSHEERQLTNYTNSFVLFSTGIGKYVANEKIRAGEEKFLALYKGKKINDNPFKIYVEKKETAIDRWDTPLTTGNKNTGIEEYITEKENANATVLRNQRLRRNKSVTRFLGGAAALLLLLGYLFFNKDALAKNNINRYLHLADTTVGAANTMQLNLSTMGCFRELLSASRDTFVTLEVSIGTSVLSSNKLRFSDSGLATMNYKGFEYDSTKRMKCRLIFNGGQSVENTVSFLPGIYDIQLLGCNPQDLGKVLYHRGTNEDTTAVFNAFHNTRYTVSIINPGSYSNANAAVSLNDANYVSFDNAIGNSEMYNIALKLILAGFPLKNIGIDYSQGAQRNIVIKRVDSITSWPIMADTTLRCLLLDDCAGVPVRSSVQLFYSPGTVTSKVTQLRTCINSHRFFNITTPALSKRILGNEVWYYRDSYRDTANLLLTCLKNSFPDKTFTMHKKSMPPNSIFAAEIYLYDAQDDLVMRSLDGTSWQITEGKNVDTVTLYSDGKLVGYGLENDNWEIKNDSIYLYTGGGKNYWTRYWQGTRTNSTSFGGLMQKKDGARSSWEMVKITKITGRIYIGYSGADAIFVRPALKTLRQMGYFIDSVVVNVTSTYVGYYFDEDKQEADQLLQILKKSINRNIGGTVVRLKGNARRRHFDVRIKVAGDTKNIPGPDTSRSAIYDQAPPKNSYYTKKYDQDNVSIDEKDQRKITDDITVFVEKIDGKSGEVSMRLSSGKEFSPIFLMTMGETVIKYLNAEHFKVTLRFTHMSNEKSILGMKATKSKAYYSITIEELSGK